MMRSFASCSSKLAVKCKKGSEMEKELYILVSVLLGAIAAYVTARVTSSNQLKIATISSDKELSIQKNIFREERLKSEVSLGRTKLEELHIILSQVNLENSQTVSYIQSDGKMSLSSFRQRYLESCDRLHIAGAIASLYYPEMTERIEEVYGQTNIFWGFQERILSADIKENKSSWQASLQEISGASEKISKRVSILQDEITQRGKILNNAINSDS